MNRKVFLDALEQDNLVQDPYIPAFGQIQTLVTGPWSRSGTGTKDARSVLQAVAPQVNALLGGSLSVGSTAAGSGAGLRFLLLSGWNLYNIGDVAITPGFLRLVRRFVPGGAGDRAGRLLPARSCGPISPASRPQLGEVDAAPDGVQGRAAPLPGDGGRPSPAPTCWCSTRG